MIWGTGWRLKEKGMSGDPGEKDEYREIVRKSKILELQNAGLVSKLEVSDDRERRGIWFVLTGFSVGVHK